MLILPRLPFAQPGDTEALRINVSNIAPGGRYLSLRQHQQGVTDFRSKLSPFLQPCQREVASLLDYLSIGDAKQVLLQKLTKSKVTYSKRMSDDTIKWFKRVV